MKVGVIGAGYWGKKHVDEYTQIGAEVVVSDIADENLEYCKEKFGSKTVRDFRELLSDKTILAVSICTPNETHYDMCKECLIAGKHVFLEKPMTLESEKANELVEMARKENLILSVGHLYRFNSVVRKLKEMVDSKEFGDIFAVKMLWTNMEPVFPDRDILFDLSIHPFDIIHYVFGKSPENAFCLARGFRQQHEEVAFVNSMLGDIMVNFELSWVTPEKIRDLVLIGSRKTAFVKLVMQKMKIRDNKTLVDQEVNIEESNTIRAELEDFLNCIETGRKPIANGNVGAEIIKTVENIKKM
jgi:UDP-N-acetylglucosamine 3-dehydrogenase